MRSRFSTLAFLFAFTVAQGSSADPELKKDAKEVFEGSKSFVKHVFQKSKKTVKKVVKKVDHAVSDEDTAESKKD